MIQFATGSDLDQIIEIQKQNLFDFSQIKNKDYIANIKKTGFFIAPHSLEELKNEQGKILLVKKEKNQVLAYIWINVCLDKYKNSQKTYKIKEIGVLKNYNRNGFGTELLEYSYQFLTDRSVKYLVSSVAFNPVINLASINFHEKHDFDKVAVSPPLPFLGFKSYQCLIYLKKLK